MPAPAPAPVVNLSGKGLVFSDEAHFTLGEWADFARDLLPTGRKEVLQRHLDDGCPDCRRLVAWIQNLSLAAVPEPEVPAEALLRARQIFRAQAMGNAGTLPRRLARLVFDTFQQLQPAGVRSPAATNRQALFEVGDYSVDLHLERDFGSSVISLTGQVANKRQPAKIFPHLPVLLLSGRRVVLRTESNDQGEFCLAYEPKRNLRICVPVEEAQIEIRLKELSFGER